jgi:hypothetical protein
MIATILAKLDPESGELVKYRDMKNKDIPRIISGNSIKLFESMQGMYMLETTVETAVETTVVTVVLCLLICAGIASFRSG